jgi:type II secretory pathway component GspD/PulD (secretin)
MVYGKSSRIAALPTAGFIRRMGLALSLCLLTAQPFSLLASSTALAAEPGVLTGDVRVTVNPANIKESLPIPGGNRKVSMSLHDVDLQDALRALSQKGGFNVLIDESVTGSISVDLNNITIQDALETLKSYGNLAYKVQGKNLMVADSASDKGKAFQKSISRVFHLHNANAKVLADFLNNTVFADRAGSGSASASGSSSSSSSGGASSSSTTVTADYNTNSLIVVGDPSDVKVVEEHLSVLDQPRMMKTWRLSQANVLDVATALSSSLFNEGQPSLTLSQGGSGSSPATGSGGGVGTTSSSLRVTTESIAEGMGGSQSAQAGGGSSSGGSSGQTSVVNDLTVRTRTQQTQTVQVSPTGPILMPDTRLNTLTLLGTAEQIAMAEPMIALLDRKVPQLVLEAALVEIGEDSANQLGFSQGFNSNRVSTGSNNTGSSFTQNIGRIASNAGENILRISTNPATVTRDFYYQINALISKNKAKMLANPTIITSSDNEAVVSIVDEILRSVTVTQGSFGGASSKTYNIGEAGIVLNILPKVGANKTVSMRVRPIVTSVLGQKTDLNGNLVTLLSKRESLAQNVQVADGETFVLAGLIHSTSTQTVLSNPLLSNLPVVGALARNTSANKHRSELVVMITPHIINDESELSLSGPALPGGIQPGNYTGSANIGKGFVPVSLSGVSRSQNHALPPISPAQPFNGVTHGDDPLDGKSLTSPMHHPSGALLPSEPTSVVKPAEPKPDAKRPSIKPSQQGLERQGHKPVVIAPDKLWLQGPVVQVPVSKPTPTPVVREPAKLLPPKPMKVTLTPTTSKPAPAIVNQPQTSKTQISKHPNQEAGFIPVNATMAGESDLSDEKIRAIMEKFK